MPNPDQRPVSRFLVELRQILKALGPDPREGTPAHQERESFSRKESIRTLDFHAYLLTEAASDNLHALDLLIGSRDFSVAPWVCARAGLEASALIVWLLDRSISVTTRVGRSLALRYEALRAQEKLARVKGDTDVLSKALERIAEVEKVAQSLGFDPVRNKKNKRSGIAVPMPTVTDLISNVFSHEGLYRILSGVAHADVVSLSQLCFTTVGNSHSGVIKVPVADPDLQSSLLAHTTAAYARAAWEVILRFGGDAAETAVSLERCFNALSLTDDDKRRFWRITPKV